MLIKNKGFKNIFHLFVIYIPFRILAFFVTIIPFSLYEKIGLIVGNFAFTIMKKTRKRILYNLDIAFGNRYSEEEKKRICKRIFQEIILNYFEAEQTRKIRKDIIVKMFRFEGEEILDQVLKMKKGVVAICAHLGNFPLAQLFLSLKGFPISMIVKDSNNRYLARYMENLRKKLKVHAISKWKKERVIKDSQDWIKKGGILCFYIDQHAGNGVKCKFFGKEVYVPLGPAVFSRKYDTPVIGIFTFRVGSKKHKILIEGPYELKKSKNLDEDLNENTNLFMRRIEYYVNTYPHQWFTWLHRRFR